MPARPPLLVAVHMGYGHLRAATALSAAAGAPVLEADAAPLSDEGDLPTWNRLRAMYESLSRGTDVPFAGPLLRGILNRVTAIPRLGKTGSQTAPNASTRYLASLLSKGFSSALVRHVRAAGSPLWTTFYAPAIVADAAGVPEITCVVTDSDVNRVWVPVDGRATRILYCVPSRRAERRLRAYGVDPARIARTGFPLPPALVGVGRAALERNLAARLVRLDPKGAFRAVAPSAARRLMDAADPAASSRPPHVVFAIGGAGAQRRFGLALFSALAEPVRAGALRLTLIAGTRRDAHAAFDAAVLRHDLTARVGDGLDVLYEPTFSAYVRRFDATLEGADLLVTKPSELTFYAALGLPLAFTPSLGVHEDANRRWAIGRGAALLAPPVASTASWLSARLADGALARAAWAGAMRLPADGTERILAAAASRHE